MNCQVEPVNYFCLNKKLNVELFLFLTPFEETIRRANPVFEEVMNLYVLL